MPPSAFFGPTSKRDPLLLLDPSRGVVFGKLNQLIGQSVVHQGSEDGRQPTTFLIGRASMPRGAGAERQLEDSSELKAHLSL